MRGGIPVLVVALLALSLAGSSAVSADGTTRPSTARFTEYLSGDRIWTGVLNFRTRRAHSYANYDATGNSDLGLVPGPIPAEGIGAAGVSYLKLRSCAEGPCWWVKNHSGVPLAANLNQWATEDPFTLAEMIRSSAPARGELEIVRGVETTRYSAPIETQRLVSSLDRETRDSAAEQYADLEQKSGGLSNMSGEAWIDGRGLPRRLRIERSGYVTTWEYYDFGVEARIGLPPAKEVMSSDEVFAFMSESEEAK